MAEFFKDERVTQSQRIAWPVRPQDKVILQDPRVLKILAQFGFTVRTGFNCYEVLNSKGDVIEVPFGDNDWLGACEELEKRCGK